MDNNNNNNQMRKYDTFNEIVDEVIAGELPPEKNLTSDEEVDMVRVAILLRSAATGGTQPHPNFLQRLRDRMQPSSARWGEQGGATRRNLLLSSAASLVAGILGGLGISRATAPAASPAVPVVVPAATPTPPVPTPVAQTSRPLVTSPNARWVWVAAVADVRRGEALPFKAGAIDGFLLYDKDAIVAISAICTHMGCHLRWNVDSQDLTCPCHEAKFDINGKVLSSYNRSTLPPLPRPDIEIRDDGDIYVLTVA